MKLLQALSINLKIMRRVAGLTQKQMALISGLDYKHYQKVELGTWPGLRIETVERLADALGVRSWELLKPSEYELRKEEHKREELVQEEIKSRQPPPSPS